MASHLPGAPKYLAHSSRKVWAPRASCILTETRSRHGCVLSIPCIIEFRIELVRQVKGPTCMQGVGPVAYMGHIGGAATGLAAYSALRAGLWR
jgi:hypothetical protein